MNEEFSGRGQGTRARENRGLGHWEGVGTLGWGLGDGRRKDG